MDGLSTARGLSLAADPEGDGVLGELLGRAEKLGRAFVLSEKLD